MKRAEPSEWGSTPTYISLRSLPEQPRSSRAASQAEGRVWAASRMGVVLQRKVHNKQRYHFQLLKQYFLFPDTSHSSLNVSVSPYDPLLFSDQQLHSLLRILQTQRIQRKIWGFIGLKMHHRSRQLQTFLSHVSTAQKRTLFQHKQHSFEAIREAATQTNQHTATQTARTLQQSQGMQTKSKASLGRSNQVSLVVGREREERKTVTREERKSVKMEGSISRRTAEEEEDHYARRRREESYTICNYCYCACCCCRHPPTSSLAKLDADLWERIQYLHRLEELAASQSHP